MVTTFYPPHIGGIEYHVENLSRNLVKRGHRITVLTSMLPKSSLPTWYKPSEGIEVVRLKTIFFSGKIYPSLSSQGFVLNVKRAFRQIIKKNQINIIHTHGHHYYLTFRAIDIAKNLKVPSVLTIHGLYALNPADPVAQIAEEIFNHSIFKRELSKVDAIVGLTPKVTNYATKYGSSSKYYVTIPNGVYQNIFLENRKHRLRYRQYYDIDNDKIVILFRGRFTSIKGVLKLAEAAKLVVKKAERVLFLFVGGGPLNKELSKSLQHIKAQSRIVSWTPSNKIHEIYLASDIFVLPSISEALPLAILEAMAAKLHIVTTEVGGISDVLRSYPFKTYIKNLSISEISNAILKSITKIQAQSTEENGSLEYLKHFDWTQIACQVEKLYQTILQAQ